MCGIIAYKGSENKLSLLINKLEKLEYRGYDSAGISYVQNNKIVTQKTVGSISELYPYGDNTINVGIGHTRWSTHGQPCLRNSHPHVTIDGRLSLVHNGIVENYETLQKELVDKGYVFLSDTDSEVLLLLIYDYIITHNTDLFTACKFICNRIVGSYAFVILDINDPTILVLGRKSSPLVVAQTLKKDFYVSSDPMVLADLVTEVVVIDDNSIVKIDDNITIHSTINNKKLTGDIVVLDKQLCVADKGDFDHFMMKEIYEQPKVICDFLSGRLNGYKIKLGGLENYYQNIVNIKNITILGCGSSYYAGLLGQYYFEELCNIKTNVEYASEFIYRKPVISNDTIFIAISQSGETADLLRAIEIIKKNQGFVIGICNSAGSSLTRLTDCGVFCRSGVEVGVASTKCFLSQILSLLTICLWVDQYKHTINKEYRLSIVDNLKGLSGLCAETISLVGSIRNLAARFHKNKHLLYLGRGYNFPIAMEGALKLKETAYIHAEGYAGGEMKHGPLALIDKDIPTMVLCNNIKQYGKVINNIREIQTRGGIIIAINTYLDSIADFNIVVPKTLDLLSPLISLIIVQIFAYYCAVMKGHNVDKPRNLAKCVTVE